MSDQEKGEDRHAMKQQIPNARLELFEGGHLFLVEDPTAFEHVIAFLKGEL